MLKKYTVVAKLKQQILDQKEAALLQARIRVQVLEEEIKALRYQIETLNVPNKGAFSKFLHAKSLGDSLMKQKEYVIKDKERAQNYANECLYHFNEASRDFEKIKYIREDAYAKAIKALKKREQNDLDEVALQLYALQGASK
ncbi:MAG: hypothetical protein GX780_01705 [Campylobacteraceae bacterium]|nr:hypothetical protein [Campylobacteraceae bacterium]